jgi:phage baseplate assembly protein W
MDDLRGFAFPFRIDPASGGVVASTGEKKLRDNLLFVLQAELGERVLRRDYGAGLRGLLQEPTGGAFLALTRSQIVKAITRFEPRVEVVALRVEPGPEPGAIDVDLVYVVRTTQTPERLSTRFGPLGEVRSLPEATP